MEITSIASRDTEDVSEMYFHFTYIPLFIENIPKFFSLEMLDKASPSPTKTKFFYQCMKQNGRQWQALDEKKKIKKNGFDCTFTTCKLELFTLV